MLKFFLIIVNSNVMLNLNVRSLYPFCLIVVLLAVSLDSIHQTLRRHLHHSSFGCISSGFPSSDLAPLAPIHCIRRHHCSILQTDYLCFDYLINCGKAISYIYIYIYINNLLIFLRSFVWRSSQDSCMVHMVLSCMQEESERRLGDPQSSYSFADIQ